MQVADRKLVTIAPYEKNTKKHPESQIKQVADSIKAFGFNQPIVVDKNGVIIVGHGRFAAAQMLGMETVPVLEVDITEEAAKAYRLADNKLNESEWDKQLIIEELKGLSMEMIDLTGFSRDLVLDNNDKDDDVPGVPSVPRSALGDLYELGDHKLLCGDSTKAEDYQKLMGEAKADMVFTDPPYNVNYKGRGENTSETIMNDKMTPELFQKFLNDIFGNVRQRVKGGGGLYVFHSTSTQAMFEEAMRVNEMEIRNQLIWNKPTASMGWGDYRWKHEPFFYASMKGNSPQFYGDRTNSTIIDFQKTDDQLVSWAKKQRKAEQEGRTTIWTMKRESVQGYVHPTQKPVELITYAIHNSSKADDLVLDPFLGSGSTLIACEKTNRICYGLELDPKFVDVIVSRYVDFVGSDTIIKNGEEILWKNKE